MTRLLSPLQVHVAWHGKEPKSDEPKLLGAELAERLFFRLQRRDAFGIGSSEIPVWFAGLGTLEAPRARPVLDDAERNVLVLVVDAAMYQARLAGWRELVESFAHHPSYTTGLRRILTVAATRAASRLSPILAKTNAIPTWDESQPRSIDSIARDIEVALVQMLPSVPGTRGLPTVFLSHAKKDGEQVAQYLRRHLHEETQLNAFFDRNNLPHGADFEVHLKQAIETSFVVIIWTDRYADSRWCRMELDWACQFARPVLILDCVSEGASRILPSMANFPLIRWTGDASVVSRAIVAEHLRETSQRATIRAVVRTLGVGEDGVAIHTVPPTLASILAVRSRRHDDEQPPVTHVYPDPPLAQGELDLLAAMDAHVRTTTQLLAYGTTRKDQSSKGQLPVDKPVVFSSSNDPELKSLGMSSDHLDEVVGGLARHLFVLGASFATGGDYRENGFVNRLLAAAQQYEPEAIVQERFQSHIVWPIHRKWSPEELENRQMLVDLVLWDPPGNDLARSEKELLENEPGVWARALTEMRRSLMEKASCLIAICGNRFVFSGRYPGVLEEIALAIEKQLPVYLIAGLGGVTRDVWRVIEAGTSTAAPMPEVFDSLKHSEQTPRYATVVSAAGLQSDLDDIRTHLMRFGLEGLCHCNGLKEEENRRLAVSRNLLEIQALVAKGLSQVDRGSPKVG